MSYLKFLQVLITLGPKLPAIFAALQGLVDAISDAWPSEQTLEVVSSTDEELACECQVAEIVAGPNAAFDGSGLRRLFKFLQESGLLDALMTTLLAKATGGLS